MMKYTFLMCSERSGSNLLTKMMDAHSLYCGPSPIHLMRLLIENRHRYGELSNQRNWDEFVSDAWELLQVGLGPWKSNWTKNSLLKSVSTTSPAALFQTIYAREAHENNKKNVFIKENQLYRFLPFILTWFPGSKIVYLVRDPRDMALSWKNAPALRGGVVRAANIWKIDQLAGLDVVNSLNDSNQIHVLRYETLIADTERELRRLTSFLGIRFEQSMLQFYELPATGSSADSAAEWKNLAKPLMKNNYNKYKSELSQDEIAFVEEQCREIMPLFNYQAENKAGTLSKDRKKKLLDMELYEKPQYQDLPEHEKQARTKQAKLFAAIRNRDSMSLLNFNQVFYEKTN